MIKICPLCGSDIVSIFKEGNAINVHEINLSTSLEFFKPEDGFEATPMGEEADYYAKGRGNNQGLQVITIADANQLLRERLLKKETKHGEN